jgi:outer membrane protein OmpA-like peptidoglycan-associated protein
MSLRYRELYCRFLPAFLMFAAIGVPTAPTVAAQEEVTTPKWELFGGYSWSDPGAKVGGKTLRGQTKGWGASITFNPDKYFGLTLDFGGHYARGDVSPTTTNGDTHTIMIGPKFTWRSEHFSPFAEGLIGLHTVSAHGLDFESSNGVGAQVGGGIDLKVNRSLAIRVLQADYIWAHHNFFPLPNEEFNGVRLQGGVVWLLGGGPPPQPLGVSATAEPKEVLAGEPVRVTATPTNVPKNRTVTYNWSATGGKPSGNEATTTIDTTGLAPGNYNVTVRATEGKHTAEATTSFTVKQPPPKNPPTMSCSANPTTVRSGESATITCECRSADNRPVNVSNWTASPGRVSGTGNTATLDTAGAAPGAITVGATCTDDRGLSGQASATVNVEAPPEKPKASKLTEIFFKQNNARVDNAAKGALDGVADRLLQDPNARAVIVGQFDPAERTGQRLAAQRAVNAKAYLTSGENQKAVDASRIEVRTGNDGGMRDEVYIVPEGATFDEPNTTVVDETKVKPSAARPARRPRR